MVMVIAMMIVMMMMMMRRNKIGDRHRQGMKKDAQRNQQIYRKQQNTRVDQPAWCGSFMKRLQMKKMRLHSANFADEMEYRSKQNDVKDPHETCGHI